MIKIKICGITKIEEIDFLNTMDIDFIGFVFAKSKRQVSINEAVILAKALRKDINVVGVFKDNTLDKIKNVIEKLDLGYVQIHGDEYNKLAYELDIFNKDIHIWKGINISDEISEDYTNELIEKYVLDGKNPGEGKTFDWDIDISTLDKEKIFLAGGLTVENVAYGIEKLKPYGIDVSSGVEEVINGERKKNYLKVKDFVERVRDYDKGKV